MLQDEYCFSGTILKPHGRIGEAIVKLNKNISDRLSEIESVFLEIEGLLVPFFLSYAEALAFSTAIVKFEDIDTPEEIRKLIGINLFFKKVDLLQKEGNEFSWRDLIRFKIVDEMLGEIGLVNDIFFYPDNPVFQIIKHGREILIPVNEDLIQKIDPESKTVFMVLPEGLTDIFR